MEYRIKSNGDLKTRQELIRENSTMSFPKAWNDSVLEALGAEPVFESPQPIPDKYQGVARDGVKQDSNGKWIEAWKIFNMFEDSIDDDGNLLATKTELETAYQAKMDKQESDQVRAERNNLLAETDWTAGSDIAMSDAMKTYRQALRDVPAQSGFPTTINWPVLEE